MGRNRKDGSSQKRSLQSPEERASKKLVGENGEPEFVASGNSEHNKNGDPQNENLLTEGGDSTITSPSTCKQCLTFNEILRSIHDDLQELRTQNKELNEDFNKFKTDKCDVNVNELKETVDFLSGRYDSDKITIAMLRDENKQLKKNMMELSMQIDDIDQYNRRNNILFDNVVEKEGEDTTKNVADLCAKVGINIDRKDIQVTHRVGAKRSGHTRPIIARFVSVGTSRAVMSGVKQQFKTRQPIDPNNPTKQTPIILPLNPVNAREHLTNHRAKVLSQCAKLKNVKTLYSCWLFNFNIYVKKCSDSDSIQIKTLDDLSKV